MKNINIKKQNKMKTKSELFENLGKTPKTDLYLDLLDNLLTKRESINGKTTKRFNKLLEEHIWEYSSTDFLDCDDFKDWVEPYVLFLIMSQSKNGMIGIGEELLSKAVNFFEGRLGLKNGLPNLKAI